MATNQELKFVTFKKRKLPIKIIKKFIKKMIFQSNSQMSK